MVTVLKQNLNEQIRSRERGFTLIEIIVVTSIIILLSVSLISNFRPAATNKTARDQVTGIILSDLRRAQSMTLAGSRFQNAAVCGYGLHYLTSQSYIIYTVTDRNSANGCTDENFNYQSGVDQTVDTRRLNNFSIEIRSSFLDIFFVAPDPKTYINNDGSIANTTPTTITLQIIGQAVCSASTPCSSIDIYRSGQINTN